MEEPSAIPGVKDLHLLIVLPIAAYWLSASVFHLFDCQGWFQKYKIHTVEDGQKRNKATLRQVFAQVIAQQVVQVVFTLAVDKALTSSATQTGGRPPLEKLSTPDNMTLTQSYVDMSPASSNMRSSPAVDTTSSLQATMALVLQVASAIVIADFWQYAWHRIFHSNKFLYKHVHSVHHRLYVPYSYGALYSSLVEAFIVDTIGTTVTFYLSGLSVLPATWFASLSIIKSVNDHSGYRFPYNPFNFLSSNTTDFHDVHHQSWGMKYNYSQVYLTIWDDLLGTTMAPKEVEMRRSRVNDSARPVNAKNEKTE